MRAQILLFITLATALAAAPSVAHVAEAKPDPASPLTIASGNAILYRPEFFAKARPSSALEMVQLIPGFTIKGGSLGRGLEGSATNVLIDNRPLPAKGEPLSSVLARIPASSVVAIVRYRSTQPGIDMGGFPEVLDIVRFPRTETGATATVSAGESADTDSRSFSLSGTHGRPGRSASASVNLATNHATARSLLARDGETAQDVQSRTRSRTTGGTGGFDLAVDAKTSLRGDVGHTETRSSFVQQRGVKGQESTSEAESLSRKASARIERQIREDLFVSMDAVHSDTNTSSRSRATDDAGQTMFESLSETSETATGARLRWRPRDAWELEAGGDFALNVLDGLTTFGLNGEPTPLPGSDILVSERRFGGTLTLGWSPEGPWSANARLRIDTARITSERDLDDSRTLTDIKPELNAQGRISDETHIDIRLAREVDQLAFSAFIASARLDDDIINLGNPGIDPQRRWVFEATLRQSLFSTGDLSLTAHGEHIDNPTELVRTPSGFDTLDNIGTAIAGQLGAQLALPLDSFGLDGIRLDFKTTVGESRVTDPTTTQDRSLSNDTLLSWSAGIRHSLAELPLTYGFSAAETRFAASYSPSEIDRFSSSPSLTGFIEYSLTKRLTVRAELNHTPTTTLQRVIYAQDRSVAAVPIQRQIQNFPSDTAAQVTLKLEI